MSAFVLVSLKSVMKIIFFETIYIYIYYDILHKIVIKLSRFIILRIQSKVVKVRIYKIIGR